MAAMNNHTVPYPNQGGTKPELTACRSLFFGFNAVRM